MASSGADMSVMAGGISAMGIQMNAQVQAQNIRQQGQDALFQYQYEAGQQKLAAKAGQIQATQTDLYMRRKSATNMGNIQAVMAMSGGDPNSPSSYAVQNWIQGQDDESRDQTAWNYRMDNQSKEFAGNLYMLQGYKAMNVASYNAIATIATGNMAAMGALMSSIAQADQMRTQKSQARFQNIMSMASSGLGILGGFLG
jgi:hypothetical protein